MRLLRTPRLGIAAASIAGALACAATSFGATRHVEATPPGAAAAAIAGAAAGDTVVLGTGVHAGPLRIEKPLVLRGETDAVVDGGGTGSVVTIASPGVTVEDLSLRRSGSDVMAVDAGVHVALVAGVRLLRLRITDVLYGVNVEQVTGLEIRDCRLTGRVAPLDETGSGNGLHLWHSESVRIAGNQVERFLDAIYLSFAHHITVEDNRLRWNGRYGLHTMYCQENHLVANVFELNVAGCALMFSNHLLVEHNDFVHNRGSRTYGLLLRDCSDGVFTGNRLDDNTIAVFMDGSNRNRFRSNLVENNGWGLLLFSSCSDNEFSANQFIQNDYPVALDMRLTNNRFDDGSVGNYWSDNAAYDLDADGIGDTPYSPVSAFAFISKQYPDLTILAKSPGVAALSVAERVLPALHPSEAVDRHPLVRPSAGVARPAGIPRDSPARPGWAIGGFLGLGSLGLAAMVAGTRRRITS